MRSYNYSVATLTALAGEKVNFLRSGNLGDLAHPGPSYENHLKWEVFGSNKIIFRLNVILSKPK